ncbi:MAG: hypothetical protein DME43_10165 [Verrucomicrobia bacterium]|nr:MAG: hypothetical protein DME43_10165 [Verrucomicrobiota bacterium]
MKLLVTACLVTLFSTNLLGQSSTPAMALIQVMVLGTYHFGNPGQDMHNMKVDSVLTPAKQAELADVASRLAKFHPTKIAVEALSNRPDFVSNKFDGFTAEKLSKDPDERSQIAFRLAHQLGQKSVYGIDEQSDTIDYFPFDKVDAYAKAHQQGAALGRMQEKVEELIKQLEATQKTKPVRLMLADVNDPARILSDHQNFYYALLSLGNEKEQPGAELNAAWYQRNAKIFAKLTQIAQPGDRILVVFGSGHAFWLRHFIQNTPGFQLIEPRDYLQ